MASDERGHWAPYVGALWDASPKGSSESVSSVDHRIQTCETEVRVTPEGGREHRPSGVANNMVPQKDVAG